MSEIILNDAALARLEKGLRRLVKFRRLEVHPPAVGSEPFYDGRSLSFPVQLGGEDVALAVLEGVEEAPDAQAILSACAGLLSGGPRPAAEIAHPDKPRVREVLPLGKLALSLPEGTQAGRRVLIWEGPGGAYKAEAEVVSVEGGRALARVVSKGDPFVRVQPGDAVSLVEEEQPPEPPGEGLEAFRAALEHESAGWEGFAVLAARLEGAEVIRTRVGTAGLEALLAEMSSALLSLGGQGAVVGRCGRHELLAALPDWTAEEALRAHERLSGLAAAQAGSVTLGAAGYPAWGFGREGALDNALKALAHAALLGPGKAAAFGAVSLNVSGDALYAQGDLEGAAGEYLRALEIDPDDTNVLNSLGVCYANLGRLAEAKEQFERAIAARPQEVMAHFNLGFAHLKQGERQAALSRFEQAAQVEPAHFEVRYRLGRLLLEDGRPAEAKGHLLAAAEADHRPYIHRHLADCLLRLGEANDAAGHYRRAVKANPDDAHSLSQLAAIYLELGMDLEVAVSLLEKSVELEPVSELHRERLEAARARLAC